jgi:hypothetical protein
MLLLSVLSGHKSQLIVIAAAAVVVLAIIVVFIMVLRSDNNKDSKTDRGLAYEPDEGPLGQPQRQSLQNNAGWGAPAARGFGAEGTPSRPMGPSNSGPRGNRGWGEDPAGNAGWGQQEQPGWVAGAAEEGWGQPQRPAPASVSGANQPPGWGQPAGQPGWNNAAPQPQPAAPGWGAPPQPQPQQNWGAPAQQPPAPGWGAQPSQQGWDAQPAQPPGWGQPAGQPGWNNAAPQPQPAAPGWGAPPQPQPQPQGWDAQPAAPGWGAPGAQPAGPAPRSEPRIAYVIIREGKEPGRTFELRKDRMSIGRSRESDIFLEDLAVSRLHASIYRDDQGNYILRDENSANGTSVNGMRVNEHRLADGDEIQVGQTTLSFTRR